MNILVVDDIDKNRTILQSLLKKKGYSVVLASGGEESLAAMRQHSIDLVLMDARMPGMDGFKTTEIIKENQPKLYLPVIFVTALKEEDALNEAVDAGADDFVSKPLNFNILLSKIKAHLRIRKLHFDIEKKKEELVLKNILLSRQNELVTHFTALVKKQSFLDENYIKSLSLPMHLYRGDMLMSARRPNGGVNVMVGDFTGQGLLASVGVLPVSQIFFKMSQENAFVGDIAREMNKQINFVLPTEMFFAASIIELSAKGDRMMMWHGGMPDAYLCEQATKEITTIVSQHLPIGVRQDEEFDDSVQLFYVNENHKLAVFTDGLSEALNIEGAMISPSLYKESLKNSDDLTSSLMQCFEEYSEGVPQADDITILELSCLPVAASEAHNLPEYEKTVPWHINLRIENEMLSRDVLNTVMELIGEYIVLKENKGIIYTLLSEMYSNTLDHGVLDLDSQQKDSAGGFERYYLEKEKRLAELNDKFINIDISYQPQEDSATLKIIMLHNGVGFDAAGSKTTDADIHGRGMGLVDAICEEVRYSNDGRCLTVLYKV